MSNKENSIRNRLINSNVGIGLLLETKKDNCCDSFIRNLWNIITFTTKNRRYLHLNLATDNSVAKFSNGFATDYTYIIFLILATDFSNGMLI